MTLPPVEYASPGGPPRRAKWLRSRFPGWQLGIALALWLVFSGLTLAIVLNGLDDADRPLKLAAVTAGTALGPMTGAISRGFQSCCLTFSLRLLPVCLGALLGTILVQVIVPPIGWWRRTIRLLAWIGGLLMWFGGGIISLAHALS